VRIEEIEEAPSPLEEIKETLAPLRFSIVYETDSSDVTQG
jgi:hypothetical protein